MTGAFAFARRAAAAAAVCALLSAAASANDTMAELRAGGLQFTHTDAIEMVSEDLFLSTREVRVRYVFRNTTRADVTARVAFPLPDIGPEFMEEPIELADESSPNFVKFRTTVDGQPVALNLEQKLASEGGADVTDTVRAAGLPFASADHAWNEAEKRLSLADAKRLEAEGLIYLDVDPQSGGKYIHPRWTMKVAFHRMQTFPAGKDVVVEHVYHPVVGGSVGSPFLYAEGKERRNMIKTYCIEPAFEATARKWAKELGDTGVVSERWLGYVLTTGANWAKPIGTFHLTIEKDLPTDIISLCADGLVKTSDTRFELKRTSFTPKSDIRIMMLRANKTQ